VDTSDGTIWFASSQNSEIYHIKKDGTVLGSLDYSKANGLAYDDESDSLWVLANETIANIEKDGSVIKSYSISGIDAADMLYLDTACENIYFTAGNNYQGDNYIYKMDVATGTTTLYKTLTDSYAVEGLCIVGNKLYVMNDGYYHSAKDNRNVMNIYTIK